MRSRILLNATICWSILEYSQVSKIPRPNCHLFFPLFHL